jgi:hypothetical protein
MDELNPPKLGSDQSLPHQPMRHTERYISRSLTRGRKLNPSKTFRARAVAAYFAMTRLVEKTKAHV